MSPVICIHCGDDMKWFEESEIPGMCKDCYAIKDMDRFIEHRPTSSRPRLRCVGLKHVRGCVYQAIWEEQ